MNLKNKTFRELIVLSMNAETQKELDVILKEIASRDFWMRGF